MQILRISLPDQQILKQMMRVSLNKPQHLILSHLINQRMHDHLAGAALGKSSPLFSLSAEGALQDLPVLTVKGYAQVRQHLNDCRRMPGQSSDCLLVCNLTACQTRIFLVQENGVSLSHVVQRTVNTSFRQHRLRPLGCLYGNESAGLMLFGKCQSRRQPCQSGSYNIYGLHARFHL